MSSKSAPAKVGTKRQRRKPEEVADARAQADAAMREEAVARGVIAAAPLSSFPQLPPGKAFSAVNGSDIYRKGGHRKAKFLFVLPGRLQLLAGQAGTLGKLEALDTPHPTLTMNFPPKGALKLTGSIIRSSARWMTLQLHPNAVSRGASAISAGARAPIVAEDVFDKMVVFSAAQWVPAQAGSTSEPAVEEVIQQAAEASARHQKRSEAAYASWHGCAAVPGKGGSASRAAAARSRAASLASEVDTEGIASSQRSRRRSTTKPVKYADSEDDEEDGDDDEDAHVDDDDDDDDDDDEAREEAAAPRQSSRKRAKRALVEDADDDEPVGEVMVTRPARRAPAAVDADVSVEVKSSAAPSLASLPATVTPFRSMYASSTSGFATASKSMWSSPFKARGSSGEAAAPLQVDAWNFNDDEPDWSRAQPADASSSGPVAATTLPAWLALDSHMPAARGRPVIALSDEEDDNEEVDAVKPRSGKKAAAAASRAIEDAPARSSGSTSVKRQAARSQSASKRRAYMDDDDDEDFSA